MVALAWSEVKEFTIQKCYAKAEISDSACLLVELDEDPFSEVDGEVDGLYELMCKLWNIHWTDNAHANIHNNWILVARDY